MIWCVIGRPAFEVVGAITIYVVYTLCIFAGNRAVAEVVCHWEVNVVLREKVANLFVERYCGVRFYYLACGVFIIVGCYGIKKNIARIVSYIIVSQIITIFEIITIRAV